VAPNPISLLFRFRDDFFITDEQIERLRPLEQSWAVEMDSPWTPISEELVKLETKDYTTEVQSRVVDVMLQAMRLNFRYGDRIREILAPVQYELIPPKLAMMLEEKNLPLYERMFRSR
jgi:hypothetical protein